MNARQPKETLVKLALLVAAVAAAPPATAVAQAPPGPPGPPPGNGAALPAPPGTAPGFVPAGTPAAIPAGARGPGLLRDEDVTVNRAKRTFDIALACQGDGTLRIRARRLAGGTLASTRYHCRATRATARLSLSRRVAKRLERRGTVAATATAAEGGRRARLDLQLTAGRRAAEPKGFWTDGHLECNGAYLVEPDFTTATTIPVSTRGWVAWYTAAGGWHWLGTLGEGASRWDTWSSTPQGIAQFHPNGSPTPTPWTWGPIAVPAGQATYAVGVYEIVYWAGGHPSSAWQYVNAGSTGAVAAGGGNLYCVYP
jgi:hypothetical protein